jgi:glutamate dehydrogenase/leucine dehydrogenase
VSIHIQNEISSQKFMQSFETSIFGLSGDPSPVTAYGVYMGMKATAKKVFGVIERTHTAALQ